MHAQTSPGVGTAPSTDQRHWHCPQAGALHLRQWDDDAAVVFDHSTGHTHLVDALAAQLLRRLHQGGPASQAQLAHALDLTTDDPGDSHAPGPSHRSPDPALAAELLAQGLATLLALDLARPVPAPGR